MNKNHILKNYIMYYLAMLFALEYSVGVMYMAVNNLPRELRYKRENIILVGIIPGPNEPKLTMNSFLKPLVEDLKEFWAGIMIPCNNHPLKNICIRAALICSACDVPATRKLCGFVGHTATLGCSKCLKNFSCEGNSKMDYSGYDHELWGIRNLAVHREQCLKYLQAKTKSEQTLISKTYGVRYSCLIELPYFNPIRFAVVDPMHNLFLGTAKHAMETWTDKGILGKKEFSIIEQIVVKIKTPHDVGRVPLKILSSFSGFTADQWRNWTTIFSPIALKQVLPSEDLRCWLLFVRACCLLCNRVVTNDMIIQADSYLVQFCKMFHQLYGSEYCTPNMHLHLHLKECLLDYGPVHGFWCYAFERCNGVLGKYHTNNQAVEIQLMRKFLRQQQVLSLEVPPQADDFFSLLDINTTGSLQESQHDSCNENIIKLRQLAEDISLGDFKLSAGIKFLPSIYEGVLTSSEMKYLEATYKFIYPNIIIKHFSRFFQYSKKCVMAGELFTATSSIERSSVVTAIWTMEKFDENLCLQVGRIRKFIKHTIKVSKINNTSSLEEIQHIFCQIDWYVKHNQENWFGMSAVMCKNFTYVDSPCCFMPIQRIANKCAHGILKIIIPPNHSSEEVFIAIPIDLKYTL